MQVRSTVTPLIFRDTLSATSLVLVLRALTKFVKGLLYDEFAVSVTVDDMEYLEIRMSVAITKLVRLHLEAMENSTKAKLELLPEKWEAEEKERCKRESERVRSFVPDVEFLGSCSELCTK